MDNNEFVTRGKLLSGIGCLIWLLILILIPIIFTFWLGHVLLSSSFTVDETPTSILIRNSPNQINQIEIKEMGQPQTEFYDPPIRIYYGSQGKLNKYEVFSFRNDGEGLSENNVKVNWENDNQVSITFLTYTSQ